MRYFWRIVGYIPGTPVGILITQPLNTLRGESYGGEAMLTFTPTDSWRLSAGYSLLLLYAHGEPASAAEEFERNAPTHQAVLRSSFDFARPASVNAQLRYVDGVRAVRAYVTADVGLSCRPLENLELSIVGQNLLDGQHPEQSSPLGLPTIEVWRGFYGKITWRF